MKRTKRNSERGASLIVVLLLTLILSGLGAGMIFMSNTDHLISANERDAERALFAAKAGLNYGFYLFDQNLVVPTEAGATFDSFATAIKTPLDGGEFTGTLSDLSASMGSGQLYRIASTGRYNNARRTTEMDFQIVPQAFQYGYMAFNEATLHNHSGLAGPSFRIKSTIFSNNIVSVPKDLTIDGTIVSAGPVSIDMGSTITGSIFSNKLTNNGTVQGKARMITAIEPVPASTPSPDRIDIAGNKYDWYNGKSTPSVIGGSGTVAGGKSSYTIQNNEEFKYTVFRRDGTLLANPDVNVARYIPPPMLDYQAMYKEALKNDNTYFTSGANAIAYLASKKVTEVIGGKTVTTIKVGTPTAPEFLYITGDLEFALDPTAGADNLGGSPAVIKAHGIDIEGGIYLTGDFSFAENVAQTDANGYPPTAYYQLRINALDYCYPAIIAYAQPTVAGTVTTWPASATPAMPGDSNIKISSKTSPHEGFVYLNGVTFASKETHMHHTKSANELIRFNGAELGYKLHNCDFFDFTYDPAVRCTRFLIAGEGEPQKVAYREVR